MAVKKLIVLSGGVEGRELFQDSHSNPAHKNK